jgi:AGZA family xanthine/uracil permease-like MFS transporter
MSYIIAVNPLILTAGAQLSGQEVPFSALVTSTCLGAFIMCLTMGLGANIPVVLASGMGINAVVSFQLMVGMHYTFARAMGVIFLEGLIITLMMLLGLRSWIINAIPRDLRFAIGGGIGGFLWVIAIFDGGLFRVPIETTKQGTVQPSTAGVLGALTTPNVLLAAFGIVLTALLLRYKVRGAVLIGILTTVVVGIVAHAVTGAALSSVPGKLELPGTWVSLPDFSLLGVGLTGLDFLTTGGLDAFLAGMLAVLSVGMSDLLDTAGTLTAQATQANMADEEGRLVDDVPHARKRFTEWMAYLIDSIAAAFGGLIGASSITSYIEGLTGIIEGGRTGLTAIATAIPFGVAMFLAPLVGIIPAEATTGALAIVGALMMAEAFTHITWRTESGEINIAVVIPVLFTLGFMMATWSISIGIGVGIILFALLNIRKATLPMVLLVALFLVYFSVGIH